MEDGNEMDIQLIEPVQSLKDEVEALTGNNVVIRRRESYCCLTSVQPANTILSYHFIQFGADNDDFIQHAITHELLHLVRLWSVPPEKRVMMEASVQEIKTGLMFLFNEPDWLRVDEYDTRTKLYAIICRSVINSVLDLWVEGEVLRRYADTQISHEQADYYDKRFREILEAGISSFNIPTFHPRASSIMNASSYAFYKLFANRVMEADDLIEEISRLPYSPDMGERLIEETENEADRRNHKDDVMLVDRWADVLGMSSWFHWGTRWQEGVADSDGYSWEYYH